jgi:hypothetical protein
VQGSKAQIQYRNFVEHLTIPNDSTLAVKMDPRKDSPADESLAVVY